MACKSKGYNKGGFVKFEEGKADKETKGMKEGSKKEMMMDMPQMKMGMKKGMPKKCK